MVQKSVRFLCDIALCAASNLFDVPLADDDHHIHPVNENDYTTNDILQQIEEENERRDSDGDYSLQGNIFLMRMICVLVQVYIHTHYYFTLCKSRITYVKPLHRRDIA